MGLTAFVQENGRVRPAEVIELEETTPQRKAFYSAIQPYVVGEDRHNVTYMYSL
jgi:hypothetical protein